MIICDAGPLIATLNAKDSDHHRCVRFFEEYPGRLLVPSLVVTEVCYFAAKHTGPQAEIAFLNNLIDRELEYTELRSPDIERIARLVGQYAGFPLGSADASVVAVAERLGVTSIATLDHRHFGAIRPAHTTHFEILP